MSVDDPVRPQDPDELAALRAVVADQQRQIDALTARVAAMVGAAGAGAGPVVDMADPAAAAPALPSHVTDPAFGDDPSSSAPEAPAPRAPAPDRRDFFRRAGAAAAGAAVAGAAGATLGATPAAAANGDPIAIGQITSGTQATTIWYTSTTAPTTALLTVADTAFAPASSSAAALVGWADRTTSVGVNGLSTAAGGVGVRGQATLGSGGVGLEGRGSSAALHLREVVGNGPPPGRTGAASAGMVDVSAGELWACVVGGTPGTWRKVAGPATAGSLHVLASTTRVYDSRPGNPPLVGVKAPLANNGERLVDCTLGGAVPAGATAVMVNVTVVNTSASGFLALFKAGIPWPGTSTVNWNAPNTIIANSAVVALDTAARFTARCAGGASTDFFVDVVGYYR